MPSKSGASYLQGQKETMDEGDAGGAPTSRQRCGDERQKS